MNISSHSASNAHQRALILQKRCPHCAEHITPSLVFRGAACPHCSNPIIWPVDEDAHSVMDRLQNTWTARRWWIYGFVTLSTLLTSVLPLIPTLLAVGVLIYTRIAILRQPLTWFSPGRRFTTRFALRLWMLLISLITLLVNSLLNLLPGVNIVLKTITCLAMTALFVEVSLSFLRGRLKREFDHGPSLQWWEWALPSSLLGATLLTSAAAVAAVMLTYEIAVKFASKFLG